MIMILRRLRLKALRSTVARHATKRAVRRSLLAAKVSKAGSTVASAAQTLATGA